MRTYRNNWDKRPNQKLQISELALSDKQKKNRLPLESFVNSIIRTLCVSHMLWYKQKMTHGAISKAWIVGDHDMGICPDAKRAEAGLMRRTWAGDESEIGLTLSQNNAFDDTWSLSRIELGATLAVVSLILDSDKKARLSSSVRCYSLKGL